VKTDQDEQRQVWIGLATVHQRPGAGVLMDRNDAFVNVLALASTQGEFTDVVRDDLAQLGFDLVELEDTERLSERRESFTIPEEINRLAELALATAKTQFDAFHTWASGDDTT
jgi:hypothetical protein